jgi:hypothetical protein
VLIDPDSPGAGPAATITGAPIGAARDLLRNAGWSVVVSRPGASIQTLWAELNASDPQRVRRWVG